MTLLELSEIEPCTNRDFITFGQVSPGTHGPPNSSPLDIFSGRYSGGVWLNTLDDAQTLASIIRMAIQIAHALDPNEPITAMRLIPDLIGPDAFGGPDKQQRLKQWLNKIQSNPKP